MQTNDGTYSRWHLRRLRAVRYMQTFDKDIAAGLYVYAVEEFGKGLTAIKRCTIFQW